MAASLLAGCTGSPVRGEATPIAVSAGQAAAMVSAYRARNGLGPVGTDPRLNAVAAAPGAWRWPSATGISHNAGGSLPRRLSRRRLCLGRDGGEHRRRLFGSLDAAMAGLGSSRPGTARTSSTAVTEIGIAAAATPPGSGTTYWTYWSLRPSRRVAPGLAMQRP